MPAFKGLKGGAKGFKNAGEIFGTKKASFSQKMAGGLGTGAAGILDFLSFI